MFYNHFKIEYLGQGYSCDSIIETGFYEITGAANAPANGDWLIINLRSPRASRNDLESVQVAYGKTDGTTWTRASDGTTWTAWAQASGGGGGTASPEDITVDASTISSLDSILGVSEGQTYATYAAALESEAPVNSLTAFLAVSNYVLTSLLTKTLALSSPRIPQAMANVGKAPDATFDKDGTDGNGIKWGIGDIAMDSSTSPRTIYMCVENFTNSAVWVQLYPAVAP